MNTGKLNFYFFGLIANFMMGCSTDTPMDVKSVFQPQKKTHESWSSNIMIATQGRNSTQAGLSVYEKGGNAFDVAVAISFAISVERPQSTGLGGGGFMVFKEANSEVVKSLDFREMAPQKSTSRMYLDKKGSPISEKSKVGGLSIGVPGLVAGLLKVQKEYGRLPLKTVVEPAIKLAEQGFEVYPHLHRAIVMKQTVLSQYPASAEIFFDKDGEPLNVGDRLIQKDLAKSLKLIVKLGVKGFYQGAVAKKIVASVQRHGGILSLDDLKNYKTVERIPIHGKYKSFDIYSMPPPSSGGIHVIEILNMLEGDDLKSFGFLSPKSVHLTAASMQQAFADRASYLGDADFVKVPSKGLTSKAYAKKQRKSIVMGKASNKVGRTAGNPFPYESDETTHFTVADINGNVVSSTQTINGHFGSGVVARGTGIVLNNEMDDFASKVGASNLFGAVGGNKNLVAPFKRPLSSMSPTIILKDRKPYMALGTPSGTRILTCVAQTILNYLEYEMPLYKAIAALRYHHQWSPDEIRVEAPGFPDKTHAELIKYGYKIKIKNLGCKVQAISFQKGRLHGVSDPRGEGLALGN